MHILLPCTIHLPVKSSHVHTLQPDMVYGNAYAARFPMSAFIPHLEALGVMAFYIMYISVLRFSVCYVYSTGIDAEWLTVCNEIQVGSSRIDFLYEGRDALEVKTPLSPFPLERIGNPYLLHVSSPAGPVLLVRHSL